MKPFLSICIPTYNRGKIVYDTVCNTLKSDRDDIEVVVSNNCSTDDTEELLMKITDSRFKYYKNEYNNGADNFISVLTYAQGDYLLLISDEDDVVLRNLELYIRELRRYQPAVMHGTAAVNRYRYASMGDRYIKNTYEALKIMGFGVTYLSGFIYNRKIMKKVLGDIYGVNVNRGMGSAYNFLDLARRMLQYGSLLTKSEVITTQRAHGKRDMVMHFDEGICVYSPEYKLSVFQDAINDIAGINLPKKQKYKLLEIYKDEIVYDTSIWDYFETMTGKGEISTRREREYQIANYYKQNKKHVDGISFYIRLNKNIKRARLFIENARVFNHKYTTIRLQYLFETIKIEKNRYQKFRKFAIQKHMLEK